MTEKNIPKTKEEWKKQLTPQQYRVLREKGTEPPFSGKLLYNKEKGVYVCAACGHPLFSSEVKFDSGSGWPSFFESISKDAVDYHEDTSLGMHRIEVVCKRCGSHLGHVFDDGPPPTGKRFCMNSVSLQFQKKP